MKDGDQLDLRNLKTQKANIKLFHWSLNWTLNLKGITPKVSCLPFTLKHHLPLHLGIRCINGAASSLYFGECSLGSFPGQACQPHVTVHVSGLLCQGCQATQPRGSSACPQLNSDTLRYREAKLWEPLQSSVLLKQKMNSRSVLQGAGGQGT